MFFVWLKRTFGKRNQVQFHWNRSYDNEPETKDDEFDFLSAQIAAIAFTNLRKLERTERFVSVSSYNFIGVEVRTWHPIAKTMSSFPSLVAVFWSKLLSKRTSIIQLLFGTVTCFQIKHWYMKHIVVPTFDQQNKATDSSPCYSGYSWRLVSVDPFSLSISPTHSLLFACCRFHSFPVRKTLIPWLYILTIKPKIKWLVTLKIAKNNFFPHFLSLAQIYAWIT